MNGIHDMGGMHGFGEIPDDETTFHEDWERIIFALSMLNRHKIGYTADEKRFGMERIPPDEYLTLPYFGRWVRAEEWLCKEKGPITEAEITERAREIRDGEYEPPRREDEELDSTARNHFESDGFSEIEGGPEPAFEPGDTVVGKNLNPEGHTRIPEYVRRAEGTIRKHRGTFHLPDALVREEEVPEPVYSVEFSHRELWGPDHSPNDTLCIDLWESYIESPSGTEEE